MSAAGKLTKLVDNVEDLIAQLGDEQNPEVRELRDRVEDAIGSAKRAIAKQRVGAGKQIGHYASSVNSYIGDYPRLAFLTGALVFGTLGYLAGATTITRK
jgi:ElaB/YqjD/DUF883 family membrane-anchored ribosome-binding protein